MDKVSEIFDAMKPLIIGLIEQAVAVSGRSSGSSDAGGTIDASRIPDALLRDGSRSLLQSLDVADGALLDGRDVSADGARLDTVATDYAAHDAADATAAHGSVGAHNHQSPAAGGQISHINGLTDLTVGNPHTQYAAAVGASFNQSAKDVDASIDKVWMGLHQFFQTLTTHDIEPPVGDAYRVGSETKRYLEGWFSELESFVLKQNATIAVDGTILLAKQNGTFATDVTASQTQIDFGQTVTTNDFIYIAGGGKVEYLKVGAVVSGTTYTVTRNLDGTGADTWGIGQPWVSIGQNGDKRIEITRSGGVRLIQQGVQYYDIAVLASLNSTGLQTLSKKTNGATSPTNPSTVWDIEPTMPTMNENRAYLFTLDEPWLVDVAAGIYHALYAPTANLGLGVTFYGLSELVIEALALGTQYLYGSGGSNYNFNTRQIRLVADRIKTQGDLLVTGKATINGLVVLGSGSALPTLTTAHPDNCLWYHTTFRCWFQREGSLLTWTQTSVGTFTGVYPASPLDKLRVYRGDLNAEYVYDTLTLTWTRIAGTSVAVRFCTAAAPTIPHAAYTVVNFATQIFATHALVTTGAAWKFTATEAGYYRVNAMVTFTPTSTWADGEQAALAVYKNNTDHYRLDFEDNQAASSAYVCVSGSTIIQLAVNDAIDVRAYQGSGAALALMADAKFNYIDIQRL